MANTTRDAFIKMGGEPYLNAPAPVPPTPPVAVDTFKNDKPVFWEAETRRLYWIKWEETGNNDIPHRQYIATIN